MAAGDIRAKLFIGILASSQQALQKAKAELHARYGEIDLHSPVFPFNYTSYYSKEMGETILRQFVSFRNLFDPALLCKTKLETISIEKNIAVAGNRIANLDPGYLNFSTVVLATTKNAGHRVYLGDGIYGEATLSFRKGAFVPFDWTYRDYREEIALSFFAEVRKRFKEQMRGGGL